MTRTSNRDVVKRFVNGETGLTGYGAVSSRGDSLYSYNAKIAEWNGRTLQVYAGWDGYSATTSKHFSYLKSAIDRYGANVEVLQAPSDKIGRGGIKDRWKIDS